MHDPRTSTALRHLADVSREPPPLRWAWAIARIDAKGRVGLPREALELLGAGPCTVRWHRLAIVLQPSTTGRAPDGRGRLLLPVRLRHPDAAYLIGTDRDRGRVVVALTSTLVGLGDVLAGADR